MKISKRQLRRIIKEVIEGPDGVWYDDYGNPLQPDDLQRLEDENAYDPDYEDRFADDQKDMDYHLAVALERALTDNPGIAGLDLVDLVKQDHLFGGLTQGDIFNTLDELVEDGTAYFDVEEDAWYYAPDRIV